MNENMLRIATEAFEFAYKVCQEEGRKGGHEDHIWVTVAIGQLSELIVRECASRVEHIVRESEKGGGTYADEIKEHFGIQ